ncbi:hypothetical protein SAMN05192534_12364 [Alteribacillus persepolensis]|uniref:Uncharacterized protein n=1 Tax=Alteribacillus persepolensis TaxID=568899 RepID=A0A1G8IAL3_9BACI|nr:hypothetical protein [Alteribacillus persepolensis]SDI15892.1 hypothetical protein SAMN05192534_12364 [Alteribacillus persepolensis]
MAVRIRDNNNIPELMKNVKDMGSSTIEAGVFGGGEQEMIAAVHEFGVDIEVTDKMRAYLHHIGIHLREDTTEIHIPERSFIRSGWDESEKEINRKIQDLLPDVLELGTDGETFMQMLGLEIEGKLKERLIEVSDPALHPATIERKKSRNPLVDTGSLNDAITSRVR